MCIHYISKHWNKSVYNSMFYILGLEIKGQDSMMEGTLASTFLIYAGDTVSIKEQVKPAPESSLLRYLKEQVHRVQVHSWPSN